MKRIILFCLVLCLALFIACPKESKPVVEEPKVELRPIPEVYQDTVNIKGQCFVRYKAIKGDNLWNICKAYLRWANDAEPTVQQIFYYWLKVLPKDLNQYTDLLLPGQIVYLPYLEIKQPEAPQKKTAPVEESVQQPPRKIRGNFPFLEYPLWFQILITIFIVVSLIVIIIFIIQDLRS